MLSIFPFYSVTPNNFINRVVVCFNLVEKRVGELFEIYRNSFAKISITEFNDRILHERHFMQSMAISLKYLDKSKKNFFSDLLLVIRYI